MKTEQRSQGARSWHRNTILIFGALCLAACGSQVGSDYPGEPRFTLTGTVKNELSTPPPSQTHVALLYGYDDGNGDGDKAVGQAVAVDGEFPARFTLRAYDVPANRTLAPIPSTGEPENHLVFANIVALKSEPPDQSIDLGGNYGPENLIGASETHVVVYAEKVVAPGSVAADWLGLELGAGYSLLKATPLTDAERDARNNCRDAAGGDEIAYLRCGFQRYRFAKEPDNMNAPVQVRLVDNWKTLKVPDLF